MQVPPMSPQRVREVLQGELGGTPIEDVFEWLDLDKPLGSASIAQVLCLLYVSKVAWLLLSSECAALLRTASKATLGQQVCG